MTAAPVRYLPVLETVQPDEGETIDALNRTFGTILGTIAEDEGHAVRGPCQGGWHPGRRV